MIFSGISHIKKNFLNYNDWERFGRKTTTDGIQIVVVNYNGWEVASSNG
jgi:hypothetical protein